MLEIVKTFKILNEKKMAINYELRKGVLLQEFGYPEMACTNDTLTDELAQWHLSRHPEKAELFSRTPGTILPPAPAVIQIFQPAPPVVIIPPVINIIPAKIRQEDPVKRKLLVDRALELGFIIYPESPIELISSEELEAIIPGLEKAKADAEKAAAEKIVVEKLKIEKPKKPHKTKK